MCEWREDIRYYFRSLFGHVPDSISDIDGTFKQSSVALFPNIIGSVVLFLPCASSQRYLFTAQMRAILHRQNVLILPVFQWFFVDWSRIDFTRVEWKSIQFNVLVCDCSALQCVCCLAMLDEPWTMLYCDLPQISCIHPYLWFSK